MFVENEKEIGNNKIKYQIVKANGCKCPRCWRYYEILESEIPCPECSENISKNVIVEK